jgi:hypothetical protein
VWVFYGLMVSVQGEFLGVMREKEEKEVWCTCVSGRERE